MPTVKLMYANRPLVLVDATPIVIDMAGARYPMTVWAKPLNGDGITVAYSFDGEVTYEPPIITNTLTNWNDRLLSGVSHIKFTRASGTGTTSNVGVVQ